MTDKEEEDVIATTLRKFSFFWPCMVLFLGESIQYLLFKLTFKRWLYFFFCIIANEATSYFFTKLIILRFLVKKKSRNLLTRN